MTTRVFKIFTELEARGGIFCNHVRAVLNENFNLPLGKNFVVSIQEAKTYSRSRYKYYFGHLMLTAVVEFNRRGIWQSEDPLTGEEIPLDVVTLHDFLKTKYNPIIRTVGGIRRKVGRTTTALDDEEFNDEYLEKVYVWLSNNNVEVMMIDEWRERLAEGNKCLDLAGQANNDKIIME